MRVPSKGKLSKEAISSHFPCSSLVASGKHQSVSFLFLTFCIHRANESTSFSVWLPVLYMMFPGFLIFLIASALYSFSLLDGILSHGYNILHMLEYFHMLATMHSGPWISMCKCCEHALMGIYRLWHIESLCLIFKSFPKLLSKGAEPVYILIMV